MLRPGGSVRRFLAGHAALIVVYVALPPSAAAEVVYLGAPAGAVAAMTIGRRRHRPSEGLGWGVVQLGVLSMLGGEAVWIVLAQLGREPFPSVADGLFLAAYPLLAVGLLLLGRTRSGVRDDYAILDAAVVAMAGAVLSWVLLMEPLATDPGLGVAEKVWALAYPTMDVALLTVLARVVFGRSRRGHSVWLLGGGLAVLLAADVAYGWQELAGTYAAGGFTDGLMMAAYGLLGAAVLHPSVAGGAADDDGPGADPVGLGRLVTLTGSALVPPAVVIGLVIRGAAAPSGRSNLIVASVASAVVFVLALTRVWTLVATVRVLTRHQGEQRFAALVENSSDVIVVVDADRATRYASPALAAVLGVETAAALGRDVAELAVAEDVEPLRAAVASAIEAGPSALVQLSVQARSADGRSRHMDAAVKNLLHDPAVAGVVVTLRDVTEQRLLRDELARQAFHDGLTGLANRALFADRLAHALDRRGARVAVLYIDLDDFKAVNDAMGHGAGDELLVAVADRVRRCIRNGDTAARLGGDEFAVLLEDDGGPEEAHSVGQRILELLALPLPVGGLELAVAASIGIALAGPASTGESVLQEADIAMYHAKRSGKCRVRVYDDGMRDDASSRLTMRSDLAHAVAAGELELVYQPIMDLRSGRPVGAEALLRWDHPVRGAVSPVEFIPLAEESGLILALGRWVLDQACREAASWPAADPPLSVSVNASASQFATTAFVDDVRTVLEATALEPSRLTIEITETVLMTDTPVTTEVLQHLRALGVRIAIDDFGTGYCSLSYLQRFPVDIVKIDRAFIAELGGSAARATLAETILQMASSLSVQSVAEGIENAGQLARLQELTCQYGQGFELERPLPAAAVRELFRETTAASPQGLTPPGR